MHHMEIFQCAGGFESFPHFSGPCDSRMKPERLNYCRHVLAAWALGARVRVSCPLLSAQARMKLSIPISLMHGAAQCLPHL